MFYLIQKKKEEEEREEEEREEEEREEEEREEEKDPNQIKSNPNMKKYVLLSGGGSRRYLQIFFTTPN